MPFGKNELVKQLQPNRDARRNLVARASSLAEFALSLGQVISFPYRFKRCVISEDEWSKVFLRDQL